MRRDSEGVGAAPGSFRDPQGRVIEHASRVFRALVAPAAPFPGTWSDTGPLRDFIAAGTLWPSRPLTPDEVPPEVQQSVPVAIGFLEHPRLAPITFPYEWPFELLKRAALMHVEFHRALLKRDLTLADGFAYNIQFVGTRPTFIDALAIVPYVEGQPWPGYAQFCESFLNPLLLAARGCEDWQATYRGRVRGISTRETARRLGWFGALRAGAFTHVILNAQADAHISDDARPRLPKFTRGGLDLLLASLARTLRKLTAPKAQVSNWGAYESDNSYSPQQRAAKRAAVEAFVRRVRPASLLDIGSNAGEYAQVALEAGAQSVVGLERDAFAVARAVERADQFDRRFLPLQIDVQNPSPAQGWDLGERRALRDRLTPDALLCLALFHHLVLGDGVPLELAVPGIVSLAPRGLLEFVPPQDAMAKRLVGSAQRLTHPYDLATFLACLSRVARVTRQLALSEGGRVLVEYQC